MGVQHCLFQTVRVQFPKLRGELARKCGVKMTLPTWPHYITLTLSPLGMAVGTAQHLILPWLYLIHSLNINSRYQHQAKGLGGYIYTLK